MLVLSFQASTESVAHRFESKNSDPRTESMLYLAAGTALSSFGFSSTRQERGADYVLVTSYEQQDDTVALVYRLLQKGNSPVAEKELLAPLDHQLDIRINETLVELFSEAEAASGNRDDAGITDLFSWKQDASGPLPANTRPFPAVVFEAGVDIEGIVFLGEFSDYFSYGAGSSLSGGITWRRKTWRLTTGIRAGSIWAFKAKDISGPDLLLSTAGILVNYGTGADKPYRFSGFVSAGSAFITLLDDGDSVTKTVPYADAGILALIPLGDLFYYGARLSFLTVYDPDSIIMGAGASLVFKMEL